MVGIEEACELAIVEELKFEEENNLFTKFPIGATMQDGGKRKEVMHILSILIHPKNYVFSI